MSFLDVVVSPFLPGDSATVIFWIGMIFVALVCGGTAVLLAQHFKKEQKRAEKRQEKQTATESEE